MHVHIEARMPEHASVRVVDAHPARAGGHRGRRALSKGPMVGQWTTSGAQWVACHVVMTGQRMRQLTQHRVRNEGRSPGHCVRNYEKENSRCSCRMHAAGSAI